METDFGWQIYAYAVLIWFTLGTVIATALIWSTMAWNPMNKLLFGYMSSVLFTFFLIDAAIEAFVANPMWVYGCGAVVLVCLALLAARWRKPSAKESDR
ncbi:MAG TPA: hypothetical protein VEY71_08085 [Chitinophagales bacterium]|nr:hypothetical protein [Chitinophagales bacterium]